jgi:SEC-C motif-containing protein
VTRRAKPGQPCPCGSGKKYKDCCASKDQARSRFARQAKKGLVWIAGLLVVAAIFYGLSQTSGFAYDEDDLLAIDFSLLNETGKDTALRAANTARCTCGCGLGLAQCVVTDTTCPIRTDNIEKIKVMVQEAKISSGS